MAAIKKACVWFLDWVVDRYIVRHRSQRFCTWLADHPWWGPNEWLAASAARAAAEPALTVSASPSPSSRR